MELINTRKTYNFDSYGRCQYGIELSPSSNTIKFTIKEEQYLYAYVVGDFNEWKKDDEYKLIWQLDPNDGNLKMMKIIEFPKGLVNGNYTYEYILVDCEGNEVYLKEYTNNNKILSFFWKNVEDELRIITSSDFIVPNIPLEMLCIKDTHSGDFTIENVVWEIEPKIDGLILTNQSLTINSKLEYDTEITLSAMSKNSGLTSTKKIKVLKDSSEGVMIHFFRNDNYYQGSDFCWNCWTFEDGYESREYNFEYDTDIGKSVIIDLKNVIIRKKIWGYNWINEWAEQIPSMYLDGSNKNIYVINGNSYVFNSLTKAIQATKPRLKYAIMDSSNKIKIKLSHEPLLGTEYFLFINGVKVDGTTAIVKDSKKEVVLTDLPKNIKASDLLEIRSSKMFMPYEVVKRNFLDRYYYSGNDMGVSYTSNKINFRLWSPTAYKVEILIYNSWNQDKKEPSKIYLLTHEEANGTHYTTISRFQNEEKFYLYRLYFKTLSHKGKIIDKITYAVDPYTVAVSVNGHKGSLIDISSNKTKPQGWKHDKRPLLLSKEDSIIYEMHIRDFTISRNSGVKDKIKGTYLGAAEKGTIYKDPLSGITVKTGLDHIKELGITHAHILPTFDFISVDESKKSSDNNRNWGYDPQHFNVPEGSYSTNPYSPIIRIKEFREMVKTFHKNGIRIVKDMVYNHMASTENMDNIVPGYYFRTDYKGTFTNGSGCGNEIATERPMVRKFIVDSCLHWITNYNIDGLRFDLMELIDLDTIKEITKKVSDIDSNILIYGEPWKGGDSPVKNGTHKGTQKNQNFSVFNDTFRNAIRGNNNPGCGYVNGDQHNPSRSWTIIEGLKGSIYSITSEPKETINYFDAHDNYTIWDQIERSQNPYIRDGNFRNISENNIFENKFVRQNIMAAGIILTAQGIPFFQGGAEILRTKQGDHNSYKSCDNVNEIHWEDKAKYLEFFNYYKRLISLRKNHSSFRKRYASDIKNNINIYFANNDDRSGVILYHIKETSSDDTWNEILIVFNSTTIDGYDIRASIPKSKTGYWSIAIDGVNNFTNVQNSLDLSSIPLMKSHSILVLFN